ncbi:MAG: hypothetical protein ACI909_001552 [Planctomycetota bacterium]|jgi:uncharacterized protein (TIGR02118 family)
MIRVNILYPKQDGGKFDYDYYINTHMAIVKERWGDSLKRAEVYKGLSSAGGGEAVFVTACCLFFDTLEDFEKGIAAHGEEIMGDLPNFTNIPPTIQFEEPLMS